MIIGWPARRVGAGWQTAGSWCVLGLVAGTVGTGGSPPAFTDPTAVDVVVCVKADASSVLVAADAGLILVPADPEVRVS